MNYFFLFFPLPLLFPCFLSPLFCSPRASLKASCIRSNLISARECLSFSAASAKSTTPFFFILKDQDYFIIREPTRLYVSINFYRALVAITYYYSQLKWVATDLTVLNVLLTCRGVNNHLDSLTTVRTICFVCFKMHQNIIHFD